MNTLPDLPGDMREAVLWRLQEVRQILETIEELMCLSEEEEKNDRT